MLPFLWSWFAEMEIPDGDKLCEIRMFFSVPVISHLCMLRLIIKLRKQSIQEAKHFK
jgi:hypothetical protein